MTDRSRIAKLVLQVERDMVAHEQIKVILTAAAATVADHRQELRQLKARLARRSSASGRGR